MSNVNIEVVNSTINTVFSNTRDNDGVVYTSSTAQTLHLGTATGQPSTLRVTNSNVEVTGSLIVTGSLSADNMGMFKNRIINGNMRFAQRGSNVTTGTGTNTVYLVDRFAVASSITTGSITQSNTSLASTDLPFQQDGLRKGWRITAASGLTNYSWMVPYQAIEGNNMLDFAWGTSSGSPATISFWYKTGLANNSVISLAIRNESLTHSYVTPVTVTSSGAWQYYSAIVPAPPNGTAWSDSNTTCACVIIGGHSGTGGFTTANSNVWQNVNALTLTGATNIWATTGNYLEITGLQFEKGIIATPFELRPLTYELMLCRRYYEKSYEHQTPPGSITADVNGGGMGGNGVRKLAFNSNDFYDCGMIQYNVPKRSTVTVSGFNIYNPYTGASNSIKLVGGTTSVSMPVTNPISNFNHFMFVAPANTLAPGWSYLLHWTADAEIYI